MLVGGGGNITVSAGPDGFLLVDSGGEQMSEKVLAALHQISQQTPTGALPRASFGSLTRTLPPMNSTAPPKPVRFIINTQGERDHVGGNAAISASGKTFTGGNVRVGREAPEGATIIAHDNVLTRMSAATEGDSRLPFAAWPTQTYRLADLKLSYFFNGEGVRIIHLPAAHADGDSMVHFRNSDVISAGDVFVPTSYPLIDLAKGGSIGGVIDALNQILDLSIPEFRMEGGTMVIPGHGRLSDATDVAYYRDMVTIIRDRIQNAMTSGMTLDQIKTAGLTLDFDGRYGRDAGSNQRFIETVYRSLSEKR